MDCIDCGVVFFVAASKASAQPHFLRSYISPFSFATPLTGVSVVPRVHHGEALNECSVVVIVVHDMRIDLMWVLRDNAWFTKLKL